MYHWIEGHAEGKRFAIPRRPPEELSPVEEVLPRCRHLLEYRFRWNWRPVIVVVFVFNKYDRSIRVFIPRWPSRWSTSVRARLCYAPYIDHWHDLNVHLVTANSNIIYQDWNTNMNLFHSHMSPRTISQWRCMYMFVQTGSFWYLYFGARFSLRDDTSTNTVSISDIENCWTCISDDQLVSEYLIATSSV